MLHVDRVETTHDRLDHADDDEPEDASDEAVRGDGEDAARLLHPRRFMKAMIQMSATAMARDTG